MLSLCLLVCFTTVGLSYEDPMCEVPPNLPEIDWSKVTGRWHDGMGVNEPTGYLDCWEWRDFVEIEGGFEVIADIRMFGVEEKKQLTRRYIEVANNTFLLHIGSKAAFIDALRKIRINRKEILGLKDIKIDHINADITWSFITDYETYFIGLKCSETGWRAYPKTRKPKITGEDVVKAMNVLNRYGIHGHIAYKNYCIETNE